MNLHLPGIGLQFRNYSIRNITDIQDDPPCSNIRSQSLVSTWDVMFLCSLGRVMGKEREVLKNNYESIRKFTFFRHFLISSALPCAIDMIRQGSVVPSSSSTSYISHTTHSNISNYKLCYQISLHLVCLYPITIVGPFDMTLYTYLFYPPASDHFIGV